MHIGNWPTHVCMYKHPLWEHVWHSLYEKWFHLPHHDSNSDNKWQSHPKCLRYVHTQNMHTCTNWTTKWESNAWHSVLLLTILCEHWNGFCEIHCSEGRRQEKEDQWPAHKHFLHKHAEIEAASDIHHRLAGSCNMLVTRWAHYHYITQY